MVDEGQFRELTMNKVKSFHVMYVLRTYIVIHIFLVLFSLVLFFVCGLCGYASLLLV